MKNLSSLQLKLAMKEGFWLMCVDNGWPEAGEAYTALLVAQEEIRKLFTEYSKLSGPSVGTLT